MTMMTMMMISQNIKERKKQMNTFVTGFVAALVLLGIIILFFLAVAGAINTVKTVKKELEQKIAVLQNEINNIRNNNPTISLLKK